jgi:hypothetical protein
VFADTSLAAADGGSSTFYTNMEKESDTSDFVGVGLMVYMEVIELNKVLRLVNANAII